MLRILTLVIWLILSVTLTIAQDDSAEACSTLVQTAMQSVEESCPALGRNQACYGNAQINATPAENASEFSFEQAGDVVDLTDIQTLQLSSMVVPDEWGIALLAVQANIPNTLPGQNVSILLFGDVAIENASPPETPQLEVTITSGMNVRAGAGTNYSVISGLSANDVVSAEARNEAADWVRVQLPDDGGTGWIYAPLVTVDGDVSVLPVVDSSVTDEDGVTYGVMQAFTFSSGVGEPQCSEAPRDGLLIQTPEGAGTIDLLINEVQVSLGSTIYLQAEANGLMTIYVVEGSMTVTANGESVVVPAGSFTTVPLDENYHASGPPATPQPYDPADVSGLPLDTGILGDEVSVAPPATQGIIDAANGDINISGAWTGTDPDGSNVRVTFTQLEGNLYQYSYIDDSASPCRDAGEAEITSSGEGILDNTVITITSVFQCTGTNIMFEVTIDYTYDPLTDTLSESVGGAFNLVLSRE